MQFFFLIVPEMTDLEIFFLRHAINEVLHDLAEASKDILEETLQSLGIETSDYFQFLEESDLLTACKLKVKYSSMSCS